MAIGLVHAGEQASILQSDGSLADDSLEELLIVVIGGVSKVGQAKQADQFTVGSPQPSYGKVIPTERGSQGTQ